MSMDSSGKIIFARHNEVQQAIVGKDDEAKDGEPLALSFKDLGSCEIYPQTLSHGPNGRCVLRSIALNFESAVSLSLFSHHVVFYVFMGFS